jgi:hypothetical protein
MIEVAAQGAASGHREQSSLSQPVVHHDVADDWSPVPTLPLEHVPHFSDMSSLLFLAQHDPRAQFTAASSSPAVAGISNPSRSTHFAPPLERHGILSDSFFSGVIPEGISAEQPSVDPPPNSPPQAVNDSASTSEEAPVDIPVLVNDSDPDVPAGDHMRISSWSVVTGGGWVKKVADATQLRYHPLTDFTGQASISYTITDDSGAESSATATVTVNPVNDAPVAFHDANTCYGVVYSGSPITFNVNRVLGNDKDYDGDALSIGSYRNPQPTGTLSLSGGGLYLTVPSGTYGMVSFEYTARDGSVESNWATGNAFIIAPNTPWSGSFTATADDYALGENAIQSSPSVLDNDMGAVLAVISSHPATGRVGAFGQDGNFTFTPDYRTNSETFSYKIFNSVGASLSATVNMYELRMDIYNGQNATAPVQKMVRLDIGAFTVANLNDTDGDLTIDNQDLYVDPYSSEPSGFGRREVDLMKLVIHKPNDPNPGQNEVTITAVGDVTFWASPYKISLAPTTFTVATMPANGVTIWVEATDKSAFVRDILIQLAYRNEPYSVAATAIWAEKSNFRNDGNTPGAFVDNLDYGRQFLGLVGQGAPLGTPPAVGPRPGAPQGHKRNAMEMEFTVNPDKIGDEPGILFRVTRNHAARLWHVDQAGNQQNAGPPNPPNPFWADFPAYLDVATDDAKKDDSDNEPLNNRIYSSDWVGANGTTGGLQRWVYQVNFHEFVRVRVNGGEFAVNQQTEAELNASSRGSVLVQWHSRQDLVPNPMTNPVLWMHNPNAPAAENAIALGHKNFVAPW